MKKILYTTALFAIIFASPVYAAKNVQITEECVYLDEITAPSIPRTKVMCGIAPGESRNFSKDAIVNYLARSGIKATVLNDVTVSRKGEKLSEEEIVSRITSEYEKAYPGIHIKIDQLRLPKEIYAEKESDFSVKIDTSKFGANYAEIHNGLKRSSVYVYIKAFRQGYVSTERIKTGERPESKIRPQLIEVTNLRSSLITDPKGLIAEKMIPQGKPITEDLVSTEPALKKGDKVRIVYDDGNLKIETAGVAETDAFVGKPVQVRNVASQKVITANYAGGGVAIASF